MSSSYKAGVSIFMRAIFDWAFLESYVSRKLLKDPPTGICSGNFLTGSEEVASILRIEFSIVPAPLPLETILFSLLHVFDFM